MSRRTEHRRSSQIDDAVCTGLGVMTWSPLAGGFLTGKYEDGVPLYSRASMKVFRLVVESQLLCSIILCLCLFGYYTHSQSRRSVVLLIGITQ